MSYKIGDFVIVIDENITGIVKQLTKYTVIVETEDGFEFEFNRSEIVKHSSDLLDNNSLANYKEFKKEDPKKSTAKDLSKKCKKKKEYKLEVDLHIYQLVPSVKGLSKYDILSLQIDTAKRQLEFAIKKRIKYIIFIHGVGEGILKTELTYLLNSYEAVEFYDADFKTYGMGATEVRIFENKSY